MRAGGALAHLLLVVVLALGVFVMHAVGHPEGSSDTATTAMGHAPDAGPAAAVDTGHPSTHGHRAKDGAPTSSSHGPGTGMDMSTLCVAVLGIWALARLVLAALRRHPDRLVRLLGRLTPALGPNAPPRRPPDLAQLSILRI
ncbi:hypothetical protein J7E93_27460 [Streptomyces sp. ISL-36]|nr:hypothetical protein [Streptomyces sp. ISL-36]